MTNRIILAERMGSMSESATTALNARAKKLAAEGKTIYNLTAGELAADTPDYIQTAVAKTLHLNKYTPVDGLPELRQAIAREARQFYGLDWIEPANVVVTAAAKPALYTSLLALVNPGDEVILPIPAWVSYSQLIELTGGKVVPVPLTHKFDLDAAAILAKLSPRTKAIIINSPHNPTGAVFSEPAVRQLMEGLKGTDVTVISDDMYARLVYGGAFTPVPSAGFDKIVIVNGFSKSQALTGWRIGYVIAHQDITRAITGLLSHMTGNAAVPSQHAALAALERHDTPPAATLKTLERHSQLVNQAIQSLPGIQYHPPHGAFYVFIDIRTITKDSVAWCERLLLETGVALVPGEAFGAPGFARLSFVTDEKTLTEALKRLTKFVRQAEPK